MPRILIPTRLSIEGVTILRDTPTFDVDLQPGLKAADLRRAIADADAVIIRSDSQIDREIIDAAKCLKLIGRAGVGVENIDLPAATARGIVVLNAPAANSIAVAELAMAMMLALARKIVPADRSVKEGRWEKSAFAGHELYGKTLGLVGFGRIGREVARRAAAFGMSVMAFDPFVTAAAATAAGIELVKLPQLLGSSDVISLHLPLNDKTRGLIGAAQIKLMKKTAFLINASRGGIIEDQALRDALVSGQIAGCALDVYEVEPPTDRWFAEMQNVVVTPHLGASTSESQTKVAVEIAEAVKEALLTGVYRNAVNLPVRDPSDLPRLIPYIHLAEQLGLLLRAVGEGPCSTITVELGAQTAPESKLIVAGALTGFLALETNRQATLVNALQIADDRHVRLPVIDQSSQSSLASTVVLEGQFGSERRRVSGVVDNNATPRIRAIDEFAVDIAPAGRVLIFTNRDRPGVIGAVGAVLGRAQINIASWVQGRGARGGTALGIVTVDDPVPGKVLEELSKLPNMGRIAEVDWGTPASA